MTNPKRKVWQLLLAAWLILWGLAAAFSIATPYNGVILGLVAIAGGACLLLDV